ncbi:MAG: carbohydrate ABC transporter, N-acetylglucosamine/diacetylchitobiose-binding protein, partial [Lapillicoccus sp.]
MSTEKTGIDRRTFMRGSLAAAALLPLGGALASCASSGTATSGGAAAGGASTSAGSSTNPFGLADGSSVDAVIFNGGYGYDYVQKAADLVQTNHSGV